MRAAAIERIERGREAGSVRDDVPVEVLASFLALVLDGLVLHLGTGMPLGDVPQPCSTSPKTSSGSSAAPASAPVPA